MTIYPLTAIRTLALHTAGLASPWDAKAGGDLDAIGNVVDQLGCLQIDTLQMVERSHYMIVWSRLGTYDPEALNRLAYHADSRRLFEYWYHGASLIPLTEYRYRLSMQRWWREVRSDRQRHWLSQPGNAELQATVLERIRREGPLRAADFKYDGPKRDGWWDWKPAKRALEYLFNEGELMVADRVNFQRVYDLRERVLPAWVDTTEPDADETVVHVLGRSLRSLGLVSPNRLSDYTYDLSISEARPYIAELVDEGVFVEVQGELADGTTNTLLIHRDNLAVLEQAADSALSAQRTTFLNPFDPLFYPRGRDQQLWGFEQVLEAYKPAAQRRWGYFCLPILHRDRLVGRFDPKLERKAGILRIKALYLEPDVEPDARLMAAVAAAMRDFLAFHQATDLVVEHSQPEGFGAMLEASL